MSVDDNHQKPGPLRLVPPPEVTPAVSPLEAKTGALIRLAKAAIHMELLRAAYEQAQVEHREAAMALNEMGWSK